MRGQIDPQQVERVQLIFHYQDSHVCEIDLCYLCDLSCRRQALPIELRAGQRKSDSEDCARAGADVLCRDQPAVQLDEVAYDRESEAEPAMGTSGRAVRLSKTFEHVRQKFRCDARSGIAPEFLPHMFERFRQADGSTTRTHGGLGLGLAIVRHLVELHGGLISAENVRSGTGAVFTVRLPLPSTELNRESLTPATQVPEVTQVDLANVRILVVKDELDALDLLRIDLTAHGAKVQGATSAAEALDLLRAHEFDLLISDIG